MSSTMATELSVPKVYPNPAAASVDDAICALSRVVVEACRGTEQMPAVYRDSLRKAFHDLLQVRDGMEGLWQ